MRLSPARPGFKSRRGKTFFVSCGAPSFIKSGYSSVGRAGDCRWLQLISLGHWFDSGCPDLFVCLFVCPCGLMDKALPSGGRDCGFESRLGLFYISERLHGAMATRRIPDPKIGGSIPSVVSSFFLLDAPYIQTQTKKEGSKAGN
jgi:hypothetical protein